MHDLRGLMAGIWPGHVGIHRQFKHPTKKGLVTVSGHPSHDIAPGTLNSILKQAGRQGETP